MIRIGALFLSFCCVLLAHKINLFIFDENGTIYIHGYFTKSAPCMTCPVTIYDTKDAVIATFNTDENGKAVYVPPEQTVIVSIDGGMGHFTKTEYTLESTVIKEESALDLIAKILLSITAIAVIFSLLWFIKRRR
ncbi:MAG: hypothetical protein LBN32_01565 [Helicobacteraceae bacterium]|jgi:hypothetical protein|nr:hypothetical protein [Helicobacteraceae bacterium]